MKVITNFIGFSLDQKRIFVFSMKFDLLNTDTKSDARAAVLTTAHGTIETPIFMPVGTAGTVKAVHHRELETDIEAVSYTHLTLPTTPYV